MYLMENYFLNKDVEQITQINELSSFLIQNYKPTDEQQLLSYKERLITLLSYNYNWLCAEYKNTGKLIDENNADISADHEHQSDDLSSKSYSLYYFNKYYLLAPYSLFIHASLYQFVLGEDFRNCIDEYKFKNKEILSLIKYDLYD